MRMPIGVIVNVLSVALGGIVGGFLGDKLSARFKMEITLVFGVCSMGMGISSIPLMENMPAVIFALIIGTAIGLVFLLGEKIDAAGAGAIFNVLNSLWNRKAAQAPAAVLLLPRQPGRSWRQGMFSKNCHGRLTDLIRHCHISLCPLIAGDP